MPDLSSVYYWYAYKAKQNPVAACKVTVMSDYPKYGVWSNSYILTTWDVGSSYVGELTYHGVRIHALEKDAMIAGSEAPQAVQFSIPITAFIGGHGSMLLPPDIDGDALSPAGKPASLVSWTMIILEFHHIILLFHMMASTSGNKMWIRPLLTVHIFHST